MLLVLPVSKADSGLIPSVERAFAKFSPGPNHNLLVVCSPSNRAYAADALERLKGHFVNAGLEVFVTDNDLGWPRACNFYFQQASFAVSKYTKPTQGFLWFELDSVPMCSQWLSIIEQEYYGDTTLAAQENRPFCRYMGAKEKTLRSIGGELKNEPDHMAPVGVYPANIKELCPVLNSLGGAGVHFSTHMMWYPLKNLHESVLFQNNRDTVNYRIEGEKIVCDSIANNAWDVHFNQEVNENAAILHGCKDGSLIDLLPADRKVSVIVRTVTVAAPKKEFVNPNPFDPKIEPVQQGTQPQFRPVPTVPNTSNEIKQTVVTHASYKKPVEVKTFASHMESHSGTATVQFAPDGKPIMPPPQAETKTVEQPEPAKPEPPQWTPVKSKSYDKRRKARKLNLSPEERQRRADRMREIATKKKEQLAA